MAYIGTPPSNAFTSLLKQDFSTSATTGYTLDHAVNNANDIALFINFVRQEPTAAYSASGTTLTLTSATASSDDMYCVYLGKAVQTVNPPNASVGASQIVDASITSAKLASGVLPTNTPAFHVTQSASQNFSNNTTTKITYDTELYDVGGGFNTTNNNFTVPSGEAGKYFFYMQTEGIFADSDTEICIMNLVINDTITKKTRICRGVVNTDSDFFHTSVVDLSVGDVVDARLYHSQGSTRGNNNDAKVTYFLGYKLIG